MSDTPPPATLDTAEPEVRRQRFENAWRSWCPGQEPPPWQQFLPAVGEPCSPDVISLLLHIDIEFRAKAGLPALLAERYFEHARLQQDDARLDAERQVELIHWEYQQRWKNGQRARRSDYEAAFPQYAAALRELKPRSRCPRCRKVLLLEETFQTLSCPDCGSESHLLGTTPPFVAPTTLPAAPPSELDLRGYELLETLGGGGMGEVYRCCDPALGRDLAIKVMKADLRGHPQVEHRFLREARVTGSLQHPGIVPVHNLGRLADGRLHYTMRLVRGRTFADILKEEAGKAERLPYLLTIFEKICQAVAYAHSKRVIHRDLKPLNVMVGRFGEVQVMDWGLAKVLASEDASLASEETTDAAGTRILVESRDTPVDLSRMGSGMGTPAYMPPEQALGEWDAVDERADVFALGSILCEILTGQSAYSGTDGEEIYRRAKRGDVTEALERLQRCSADAALSALCRECLNPQREARPRDADAVAKRVAEYQAEVQERLRQAELERTEAQVKAREQTKRRRLALALATMVLILVAGGIAAFWWQQRQDARQRQGVEAALLEVERLQQQARWAEARKVLEQAESRLGEAGPQDLRQRLEQARRDLELVVQLDAIRLKRARSIEGQFDLATADRDYEAAFRTAGIGEVGDDTAVVGERIGKSAVSGALVASLDDWAVCTRGARRDWVLEVVRKADPEPVRDSLRDPQTWEDGKALARLAEKHATELSPQLLAVVGLRLVSLGQDGEPLLTKAQERYPTDFWIYYALGEAFSDKKLEEAVGYFRAALALRPGTSAVHFELGRILRELGRVDEAIHEYDKAIDLDPQDAIAHSNLSNALRDKGRLDQAITEAQKAIELDPKYEKAHNNLAAAFIVKRRLDEAIEELRIAIRLDPNYAKAHYNLGLAQRDKGCLDEAIAEYQKAIELDPKNAQAHNSLGAILCDVKRDFDGAMACFRKAIELDPKNASAHDNFGNALYHKGRRDEAIAEYQKAIDLNPKYALAYSNLSNALCEKHDLPGAIAQARKAIDLDPKLAAAHTNLGKALLDKGDPDGAIPCFRRAIDVNPKYALAHNNLGVAFYLKDNRDGAIACFRKAIECQPDYAQPYVNLSSLLLAQTHFTDALAVVKKGLDQLPSKDPMRKQLQQLMQRGQRLALLDARLPAVLRGTEKAGNTREQIEFAELCASKKRNPAAARLYAEAFINDPKLAADLDQQHRYNAACSAALAAAGQSEDARLLPDKVVTMFRRWALGWLRDDLTAYGKLAERNNPQANQVIQQRLSHWRGDPDLASVRDPRALDRLPENERAAWQALWRDVDELAKRFENKDKAGRKPDEREEAEQPKTDSPK